MPPRAVSATPHAWRAIGEWIVHRRESLDMAQRDLVQASGVSQSVVSKIENGRPDNGRVRSVTLRDLSKALGLGADQLEQIVKGGERPADVPPPPTAEMEYLRREVTHLRGVVEGLTAAKSTEEMIRADPALSENDRDTLAEIYLTMTGHRDAELSP